MIFALLNWPCSSVISLIFHKRAKYLFGSMMAFKEVLLFLLTVGSRVKITMETVLDLSEQKITRIHLPIDSHIRVRHHYHK